ncbi:MAG: DUF1232 domain-containing protein [bacterium]
MDTILRFLNNISEDHKKQIENAYSETVKKIGKEEIDYIFKKIFKKLVIIETINLPWITELTSFYRIFYEVLEKHTKKVFILSSESYNAICAALFYFINPFDIFSDIEPDRGYIDDLYVLTLCIKSISPDDRQMIQKNCENIKILPEV